MTAPTTDPFTPDAIANRVGLKLRRTPGNVWLAVVPDQPQPEQPAPQPPRPRPGTVLEMVGQEEVRSNLLVSLHSARTRKLPAPHCLFYGPAGTGKTTLARVVSTFMGSGLTQVTPPMLESPAMLASVLLGLRNNDVLFIDEIHELRRRRGVLAVLLVAAEDGMVSLPAGRTGSRTVAPEPLPPFTLVGATTDPGDLPAALLRRFTFRARLAYYTPAELAEILIKAAPVEGCTVTEQAATTLAKAAKATPATAISLLRLARDLAVTLADSAQHVEITPEIAATTLRRHHIDSLGLDADDRLVLSALCQEFDGGPTGIDNLVSTSQVDTRAVKERIIPYLVNIGFIKPRGTRGVLASPTAFAHLNIDPPRDLRLRLQ